MIKISVRQLRTLREKMKGLIGVKPVYPVFFATRWGIHTFGVLTSLDVLILDSSFRVVRMKEHLKPNRLFLWLPIYKYVVELPGGTIGKKKITLGERIELI